MPELDFDRSLPPIMPGRGAWFNERVAELVEAADGDEAILSTARVEFPRQQGYFYDIPILEYATEVR